MAFEKPHTSPISPESEQLEIYVKEYVRLARTTANADEVVERLSERLEERPNDENYARLKQARKTASEAFEALATHLDNTSMRQAMLESDYLNDDSKAYGHKAIEDIEHIELELEELTAREETLSDYLTAVEERLQSPTSALEKRAALIYDRAAARLPEHSIEQLRTTFTTTLATVAEIIPLLKSDFDSYRQQMGATLRLIMALPENIQHAKNIGFISSWSATLGILEKNFNFLGNNTEFMLRKMSNMLDDAETALDANQQITDPKAVSSLQKSLNFAIRVDEGL
jgi:hypothetical protein